MKLNQIKDNKGARQSRVRVGRGIGSGLGKTAGRGQKGAKARSGVSINGFEGGQTPLHRRLPKRGFSQAAFRAEFGIINLGGLQRALDSGALKPDVTVNGAALVAAGVLRRVRDGVRLLAKGELKSPLTIEVVGASKAAVAAVEKLGGKVVVTGAKPAAEKGAEKGA